MTSRAKFSIVLLLASVVTLAAPTAPARAAPKTWCGDARSIDDLANEVQNGSYRYHAIYAFPADRRSRLDVLGARLQADAFAASGVVERSYGRAIRFDIGTSCGPRYLDISSVRLPLTTAELAQLRRERRPATFQAVAAALRGSGFSVSGGDGATADVEEAQTNYLVWLDGPAPAEACGEGQTVADSRPSPDNRNNSGGRLALIYRPAQASCGYRTVLHEIAHNLGALQPQAPNAADDGVHCTDAWEDVMCARSAPVKTPAADLFLDYGNDDYWDPPGGPPLPWWTLNLSRFICDTSDCNRQASEGAAARAKTRGRERTASAPRKRAVRAKRKAAKQREAAKRRKASKRRNAPGRGPRAIVRAPGWARGNR